MKILHWFAWLVLTVELPVPVYWLIFHGAIRFWRGRGRAAYWVAVGCAWGVGGWTLYHFRAQLWTVTDRPPWAILAGAVLIGADIAILVIVETQLGGRRLVGQAELAGDGELFVGGLYARVRHPRYLGMILGVLGVCLLAASQLLWMVAALWWIAALVIIWLEERELRARFGAAYIAYAQRVPALLPLLFRAKDSRIPS
jgi:protein-S-isoprenylcysteine O-methyltransferase Ste14